MILNKFFSCLIIAAILSAQAASGQSKPGIYVDAQGVIRWKDTNKEAAFFGVNYTVPFAYGYRSHKALGLDPQTAIQQDVYHMARLGLDAFRVHVWDTEISDSAGNLLQNEHLRLFDFLVAELKKRNIKTLVTPIAFWGNGYPEKDENTPGFSRKYGKDGAVVKEEAIKAQENYLKQFFSHVNPYTKKTYRDDPDIIATEINNEPHHSGEKSLAKNYVNRLAAAIRSTGWTKPVFYNISESPWYSDAVANANIDGVSFQWYPTNLVANRTLKGNFLPNVDRYHIPFDSIPAFKNKARMVYEFDAGDVMQPIMYPAMARSFRTAGFQWATQFAYDPMATAYANTEYQTHYLNLAYTPAKAISLMIAARAFHQVPRLKSYGVYPANSSFENFRLSYKEALSELNSPHEFYYSNNTSSTPVKPSQLQRIAGVGSSSLVKYSGSGAYFLDKLQAGIWRLEVMPDAIPIRDPFEKASLKKEVTRIEWKNQSMEVLIAELGDGFHIQALAKNDVAVADADKRKFRVLPGVYILSKKGVPAKSMDSSMPFGVLKMGEFVAPKSINKDVALLHNPTPELSENTDFTIQASVAGISSNAKLSVLVSLASGENKTIPMDAQSANIYAAVFPARLLSPGMLQYRIVVEQEGTYSVFPGNHKGDPAAWDNYSNECWTTFVAAKSSSIELFNASKDSWPRITPSWDNTVKASQNTASEGSRLTFRMHAEKQSEEKILGIQCFVGDKLSGRLGELTSFKSLIIKGRSSVLNPVKIKVLLVDREGRAYAASAELNPKASEVEVSLSSLVLDSALLLPRPYPGFQPLWFKASGNALLDIKEVEKLEIRMVASKEKESGFEIEAMMLKK